MELFKCREITQVVFGREEERNSFLVKFSCALRPSLGHEVSGLITDLIPLVHSVTVPVNLRLNLAWTLELSAASVCERVAPSTLSYCGESSRSLQSLQFLSSALSTVESRKPNTTFSRFCFSYGCWYTVWAMRSLESGEILEHV